VKLLDKILQGKAPIGKLGYNLCGYIFRSHCRRNDRKRVKKQHFESSDILLQEDISCGKRKNALLDLYRPVDKKEEKLPLLFDIHGGGFMYGDRKLNYPSALSLARLGYVVSLHEYTIAPKGDLYQILKESYEALTYLIENADRWNIDSSKLFLVGDSAGGMIALMLASLLKDKELCALFGFKPLSTAPLGIALFSPMTKMEREDGMAVPYKVALKKKLKKYPCYDYLAHPIKMITKENAFPLFFTSSKEDMLLGDSEFLKDSLSQLGYSFTYLCAEKGKEHPLEHIYPVIYPEYEESKEVYQKLALFLDSCKK